MWGHSRREVGAGEQEVGAAGKGVEAGAGSDATPPWPSAGLSWAALLKRVFAIEVLVCPSGGGRRRIVGVYTGGQRLRELLERLRLGDGVVPNGP